MAENSKIYEMRYNHQLGPEFEFLFFVWAECWLTGT